MLFKVISVSPLFFAYTPLLTFMYSTLPGYILQKLNIKTFFFYASASARKRQARMTPNYKVLLALISFRQTPTASRTKVNYGSA